MDGNPRGSGLCIAIYIPQKNVKSPSHLVFGREMILPIKRVEDWRYIRQRKQMKIYKDSICENTTRIDNDYRVGDKVMTITKSEYKYKTPFKVRYGIFHTWTNRNTTL